MLSFFNCHKQRLLVFQVPPFHNSFYIIIYIYVHMYGSLDGFCNPVCSLLQWLSVATCHLNECVFNFYCWPLWHLMGYLRCLTLKNSYRVPYVRPASSSQQWLTAMATINVAHVHSAKMRSTSYKLLRRRQWLWSHLLMIFSSSIPSFLAEHLPQRYDTHTHAQQSIHNTTTYLWLFISTSQHC